MPDACRIELSNGAGLVVLGALDEVVAAFHEPAGVEVGGVAYTAFDLGHSKQGIIRLDAVRAIWELRDGMNDKGLPKEP